MKLFLIAFSTSPGKRESMFDTSEARHEVKPPRHVPCATITAPGRYRNDPYRASVLPPLSAVPPHTQTFTPQAETQQATLPRMNFASRKKGDVARAVEFSAFAFEHNFAFVRFKHESVCFRSSGISITVGDYVVVEGDRGENVGMVEQLFHEEPSFHVPCRIIRVATAEEAIAVTGLRLQEREMTRFVQSTADALSLRMSIVDVECQTDRQKITIYFESDGVVDFRRLQRNLYRHFGCRIWLVNWSDVVHRNRR